MLPFNTPTAGSRMNSAFEVEGVAVVLHPLDMISVVLDQFGEPVGSLADTGPLIADAMDELLTRS